MSEHERDHRPSTAALAVGLGGLVLLGLALGWRQIASPDLGFHLATARWILEHGAVPTTDAFTYTVGDHAYVDLQWLFQLLVHGLHSLGGTVPILLATTAATLLFGALSLLRARLTAGRLGAGALLLLLVFFLGNHWEPRPHLISWVLGSAILLALEEHARGRGRLLPVLPIAMVLWVNSHSLFVLGLVVIGAFVAAHLWRLVAAEGAQLDRKLLIWSGAAVVACLANPYLLEGLTFPLVQFADIQGGSAYKSPEFGIAEFKTPFSLEGYTVEGRFVLFQPLLWWQVFFALSAVGLLARRREASLVEWLLFGGFAYVLWSANKNFGYFAMAVFPSAAAGLTQLGGRLPALTPSARTIAVGAAALLLTPLAWSGRLYDLAWAAHQRGPGFNGEFLPVAAAEFLVENGVEGRVLNTWNDGGYLAWRTGQPVFIYSHGEVMTQAFYREYVGAKGPGGAPATIAAWEPTIAVLTVQSTPFWLADLNAARDWRLVFTDHRTAIYLHESAAPEVPALPELQAGRDYESYDATRREAIVRAAVAKPAPGLGHWLGGAAAFPTEAVERSAFLLQTGRVDAAMATCLEALDASDVAVPDLLLNLGYAFNLKRRFELADLCFDAFLRLDDDEDLALGIRQTRRGR